MDLSIIDVIVKEITILDSNKYFLDNNKDDNKIVIQQIEDLKNKIYELKQLKNEIITIIDI
jgi:hypothetical protein